MSHELSKRLHLGNNITGSFLKIRLLSDYGFSYISDANFVSSVKIGEGINPLIMYDRFPDSPIVMNIAERKALAVSPHVNYLYYTHGIVFPVRVNDAVYSFKNGGTERTVVNKAESDEDIRSLNKFYQEVGGNLLYSTAASHLVMPNLLSPIAQTVFTKLRLGRFINPRNDFVPDREHAAGFTTREAIQKGLVKPIKEEMKFELIFFDHKHSIPIKVGNSFRSLEGTLQRNFETRVPFTGDGKNLKIIQALALGIVPDEISDQLKEVKEPKFYLSIR